MNVPSDRRSDPLLTPTPRRDPPPSTRRESSLLAEPTPSAAYASRASSSSSSSSSSRLSLDASDSSAVRSKLDALDATQADVAEDTARLAAEVKRLSRTVAESARAVGETPGIEGVAAAAAEEELPVASGTASGGYVPRYMQDTTPKRDADRSGRSTGVAGVASSSATGGGGTGADDGASSNANPLDGLVWNLPEEPPAPPVARVSGEGAFPRPGPGVPLSGPGGADARAGRVPSGGFRAHLPADVERMARVREAMRDAFEKYETYAMGFDELQPQTKRGKNAFGGLGATVIDSLDTLWIMGLSDQYAKARNWVAQKLHFEKNYEASVFETTIRIVGGLLATYDLSGDEMYLEKCLELAKKLEPAFRTETGIPYSIINLYTGEAKNPGWSNGASMLAEFGTVQMEFIALSERTGDRKWADLAENVVNRVLAVRAATGVPKGLYPIYLNPHTAKWTNQKVSFGAMGDSWYEYLLKVWVMCGRTREMGAWRKAWEETARGMIDALVFPGAETGTAYVGELNGNRVSHKMDHLACFVGGMLVLGAEPGARDESEYMDVASGITKTCYRMYSEQPTGIAPEYVNFQDKRMHAGARFNIQRPEAIESIFYMYRRTGEEKYREWAWEIFLAMEKHYKTPTGWVGLKDVGRVPPGRDNTMQSFFLAETLKYLYLIFCDADVINLDEWVFNTEAHPIRVKRRDHSLVTWKE